MTLKRRRWLLWLGLILWLAAPFVFEDGNIKQIRFECSQDPDCTFVDYIPVMEFVAIGLGILGAPIFWISARAGLLPEMLPEEKRQNTGAILVIAAIFGSISALLTLAFVPHFPLHAGFWAIWAGWLALSGWTSWKLAMGHSIRDE